MQFSFNVNEILKDSIVIIDSKSKLGHVPFASDLSVIKSMSDADKLSCIIDEIGKASARAQELPGPITTTSKLRHSDHRVYLLKVDDGDKGEVVGLLKVGYKTLFIYDNQSNQNELKPLCVLDFYVHESKQRQGYGKMIFEWMLQTEKVQANHIAIDRPSPKFLRFLAKHYQLVDKIPQLNNFVVFVNFFNGRTEVPTNHSSCGYIRYRISVEQSLATVPQPQMSPTKEVPIGAPAPSHTRRRASSGLHIPIEGFSMTKEQLYSDGPAAPALPRNGTPQSYKAMLSRPSAGPDKSRTTTLPPVVKRPLDIPVATAARPCHSNNGSFGDLLQARSQQQQQQCDRQKREYNYSLGLSRHYSHTRLW